MWYDLVTAGILVVATWRGAGRGFVWQLATIAAIVLSFGCATPLSAVIAPATGLKPPIDRWVSLLGAYVVLSFVCFAVARYLRGVIEKVRFEEYDRHLGALFGFLKGTVICLVVTFFGVTLAPSTHAYVLGSYSGYASAMIVDELRPVVPEAYHETLDRSLRTLQSPDDTTTADDANPQPVDDGTPEDPVRNEPRPDPRPAAVDAIIEFLERLPRELADDDRALIRSALESASEDERTRLLAELAGASPEAAFEIARDWLLAHDAFGEVAIDARNDERRAALLAAIAEVYTPHPAAQAAIVEEVSGLLSGVPVRVQIAVLEDWYADLSGATVGEDPDPRTTIATPLDERLRRGFEAAGATDPATDSAARERSDWWSR